MASSPSEDEGEEEAEEGEREEVGVRVIRRVCCCFFCVELPGRGNTPPSSSSSTSLVGETDSAIKGQQRSLELEVIRCEGEEGASALPNLSEWKSSLGTALCIDSLPIP